MSGKLATQYTPQDLIEEKEFYNLHSILYYIEKDNPRGETPENPENDSQFLAWEEAIRTWSAQSTSSIGAAKYNLPPQDYDDIHTEENMPIVSILSPEESSPVQINSLTHLLLKVKNTFPIQKIEVFFDDRLLTTISNISIKDTEYSAFIQIPQSYISSKKTYTITVRGVDTKLNKGEARVGVVVE